MRTAILLAIAGILGLLFVGTSLRTSRQSRDISRATTAFRTALSAARDAEAQRYAPDIYASAEQRWEASYARWQRENRRFGAVRNLDSARRLAQTGTTYARAACAQAIATRDSMRTQVTTRLPVLEAVLDQAVQHYRHLPMTRSWRHDLGVSQMLMTEARAQSDRGDFIAALQSLDRAIALAARIDKEASRRLGGYLASSPVWDRWVAETIRRSRENQETAIVIVKMARSCRVYSGGRLTGDYPAEFGPNWMSHKQRGGDGATPEGKYVVRAKKGSDRTKYFRALEINYPNDEDRRRFAEARKAGRIVPNDRLGGLIEIHGCGGKGCDWTEGCVALVNADMEKVFRLAHEGTPVTIVGSLSE